MGIINHDVNHVLTHRPKHEGSKLNELWMSLQKEHGKGMLVYMF